jgi:hypothetical protein
MSKCITKLPPVLRADSTDVDVQIQFGRNAREALAKHLLGVEYTNESTSESTSESARDSTLRKMIYVDVTRVDGEMLKGPNGTMLPMPIITSFTLHPDFNSVVVHIQRDLPLSSSHGMTPFRFVILLVSSVPEVLLSPPFFVRGPGVSNYRRRQHAAWSLSPYMTEKRTKVLTFVQTILAK